MLGAFFPNAAIIALTATANKMDRIKIKDSLNMKNPVEVIGDGDRPNIFYSKVFREGHEIASYENILMPIAQKLMEMNVKYPITILYLPLRWCGFAYKLFDTILGSKQYFPPGADPIPEKRMFAQYHAPQTLAMKEIILRDLTSRSQTVPVIFATVAIGMGLICLQFEKLFMLDHPHLFSSIFKKLVELAGMGCHLKQYFTTITEIFQRTDM